MTQGKGLCILPVAGLPEFRPGDPLAQRIAQAWIDPQDGDILVVASKVVAKVEGRVFRREEIRVTEEARRLASLTGREAAYMQLVLEESERVVKVAPGVIICRTRHGFVLANAGVDASNAGAEGVYIALPLDPEASVRALREALCGALGKRVAVILSDSFGRAWRRGQTDVAIACAGIGAFREYAGRTDRDGRPLRYTLPACADELAGAAELVMGKSEGICAVCIRGFDAEGTSGGGADIPYPPEEDLFL